MRGARDRILPQFVPVLVIERIEEAARAPDEDAMVVDNGRNRHFRCSSETTDASAAITIITTKVEPPFSYTRRALETAVEAQRNRRMALLPRCGDESLHRLRAGIEFAAYLRERTIEAR